MHLFTTAYTRSRISKIDSEIATHKMSITELKYEQAILEDHLAGYVYPVLTLPNEIVSEIFLQTLDPSDTPFHPSNSLLSGPTSPLFLGHICGRWRAIARSTPSLWTTISLTTDNVRSPNRRLRLLDIWLTRSRQCLLSITITDNGGRPDMSRRFVDAIAPHHRRWRGLMLKVRYDELPQWPRCPSELPMLRVLHIWPVHGLDYRPPPTYISSLFLEAPKLSTVVLHGVHRAMFDLPWEQLTSLSILTGGCLDIVGKILRSAPNLTDCTVELGQLSVDITTIDLPPIPPLMHL
ncbi:hypothetical protein DFH06DRAFT_989743 [Mycena polygramma]|nr:hypothetical protein DFH06DRAFT_989743 [Mycena polygramma]